MRGSASHVVWGLAVLVAVCATALSQAASVVGFSEELTVTSEDRLTACVALSIDPPSNTDVYVEIVPSGGTAKAGEDFAVHTTSVYFPLGTTNTGLCFEIKTDCERESNLGGDGEGFETVEFQLRNPTQGAILGRDKTAVKILDGPGVTLSFTPDPGLIYVPQPGVAYEGARQASIPVYLDRQCPGEVAVGYYTTNRTAAAGKDYEQTVGSLFFGQSETNRTIVVPLMDDSFAEGDEVFEVVLTNPSGATFLGPNALAVLLRDDERPVVRDATFDTEIPPDGDIETISLQPDGKVLIGGSFFSVDGFASRSVARLNTDGSVDQSFRPHLTAGINGPVRALQLMPDGSLLIAGPFTLVQGYALPGVARLGSNGVVDLTFQPLSWLVPSEIKALALSTEETILMAGSSFSGPKLGRYLPDGRPDPTFPGAFVGGSEGKTLLTIGLQSTGKIVAGGEFSQIHGVPRLGLVRFNADGSVDKGFDVRLASRITTEMTVRSLLVEPDDKIVIAGLFESVNGAERPGLARLNADGSLDTSFQPPSGGLANFSIIRALVPVPDDSVLSVVWGMPLKPDRRSHVVRLDSSGKLDPRFNPASDPLSQLSYAHTAVVQPDGRVLVAGAGIERLFWDSSGLRGVGFSATLTNRVEEGSSLEVSIERLGDLEAQPLTATLATRDGSALGGRDFVAISTNVLIAPGARSAKIVIPIIRDGEAELEESFELLLANPGPGLHIGGMPRFGVVIADKDPPSILDWSFRAEKASARLIAVQPDGKILLAEVVRFPPFFDPSGPIESKLWRLQPYGSVDYAFQQAVLSNLVAGIVLSPEGKLLVATTHRLHLGGGVFLFRLHGNGSLDITFNPPNFPFVGLRGMAFRADGKVIVATSGGVFLLNEDGSRNDSLNLERPLYATAFAVQADGKFLVHHDEPTAGDYLSVQRHFPDGTLDAGFQAPLSLGVEPNAIAAGPDGSVFIAGNFEEIYGIRLSGLAKLQPNGVLDLGFNPNAALDFRKRHAFVRDEGVIAIHPQPDGKVLLFAHRFGLISYPLEGPAPVDSVIRLNPDGSLDGEFQFDRMFKGLASISATAVQPDGNILLQATSREIWGDDNTHLIRFFGRSHSTSRISLATNSFSVGEPESIPKITVQREGNVSAAASVDLRLSGGTATEGEDFTAFVTRIEFSPLEAEKSIPFPVRDDPFAEPDETCTVALTSANNAALNLAAATVTIVDNDRPGSLDFSFDSRFPVPAPNEHFHVDRIGVLENGTVVAGTRQSFRGQSWSRAIKFFGPDGSSLAEFSSDDHQLSLAGLAGVAGDDVYVWAYRENKIVLLQLTAEGILRNTMAIEKSLSPEDASVLRLPDESLLLFGLRSLSRLLPDGTRNENFASGLTLQRSVFTAALDSVQRVLLGSSSLVIDGHTNAIARVNRDGTLDTAFSTRTLVTFGKESGWVYAVAEQADGRILLGGNFDACNGVPRRRLARLHADGSLDTEYDPGSTLVTPDSSLQVRQIAIEPDGKALVLFWGYQSGSRLLRVNLDGAVDQSFVARTDSLIRQFALQSNGQILIAGSFRTVNGIARPGLARLNASTPLRLHGLQLDANGAVRVSVAASTGLSYALEVSDDLRLWVPVATNRADNASFQFEHPDTEALARFYRVRKVE